MFSLKPYLNQRLTKEQYIRCLQQEWHLARHATDEIDRAAWGCENVAVRKGLFDHADEERQPVPHRQWVEEDLAELGANLTNPTAATSKLLSVLYTIARSRSSYRVLGLSLVAESFSPQLNLDAILPHDVGTARRFIDRHAKLDVGHVKHVKAIISHLNWWQRMRVRLAAIRFKWLFARFLISARNGPKRPWFWAAPATY
jgi:hypothetical protein